MINGEENINQKFSHFRNTFWYFSFTTQPELQNVKESVPSSCHPVSESHILSLEVHSVFNKTAPLKCQLDIKDKRILNREQASTDNYTSLYSQLFCFHSQEVNYMYLNDNTFSTKEFWPERISNWGKRIEEGMYIFSDIIAIKIFLRIKLCKGCLWTAEYTNIEYCKRFGMTQKWAENECLTYKQVFLTLKKLHFFSLWTSNANIMVHILKNVQRSTRSNF